MSELSEGNKAQRSTLFEKPIRRLLFHSAASSIFLDFIQSRGAQSLVVRRAGPRLENHMALSFAADIRPLFRDDPDVETMKRFGLDLASYAEVKEKAPEIYATLEDGSMPCDEPWSKENLALFKRWMDEGMAG
jgi:hypothetical protein